MLALAGAIGPGEIAQLGRLRRSLRRIKTRADQFEDAAELEIVADDLSEQGGMILGLIRAWSEVGDCDTRLFESQAGTGFDPVLRTRGARQTQRAPAVSRENIFEAVQRTSTVTPEI